MANVKADIEAMTAFLSHLRRFDQTLEAEFRSMLSHWKEMGQVWDDAKYQQFGGALREAAQGVQRYLDTTEDAETHLAALIENLRVYLNT